ncbi:MAG: hypothetical protein RLZZ227_1005 [Pseudomonadota bacterium]|jgi:uncharacterized RDD family membrane protein YckC
METKPPNMNYATFWDRFLAFVLDNIVVMILLLPLLFLAFGRAWLVNTELLETPLGYAIQLGVVFAYLLGFWKLRSATPGKILMDIAIVDADTGGKPTSGRLMIRCVGYYLSALPLFLGFFWVAFDKRKQGFHDKLANTVVIMNPPRQAPGEKD